MVALLERTDEWDALTAAADAAARCRGSVVLVSGEAGIGKTSLVRAFAEHVAGRTRLLVGGCDDLLTARPLGPLRDAVAGSGGPLETALRTGGDVFAAVVAELAGPRVTAVVVEDLHWADDATLDVLGYLARRIADLPAVLVLTYRDEAAVTGHPLHRLLGSLVGRPVVRLPLRSLSSAAVIGLASGSGWDPRRLHALTGGNPFYVTEALAEPRPGVPISVSDAVLARISRLADTTRAAVEQLSVVPTIVGLDLANSLLGERLDALAEAEMRGIITSGADGLTFRHELARQAVEQSLLPLRRRTLHRAVVAALQAERAPDLARLVHHAAAAEDGATVSRYAPLAGREAAAAGSHRQALAHFSSALRHGHRLADADLARLIDEHAWELYNAGRFVEALHGGERAVRLRRRDVADGGRAALAEALVRLSRHRFMVGDPDGADAAAAEAVTLLDAERSPSALAFAATYLAAIRALTGVADRGRPPAPRRGAGGRRRVAEISSRCAATTRASPVPTSTTTPASRCWTGSLRTALDARLPRGRGPRLHQPRRALLPPAPARRAGALRRRRAGVHPRARLLLPRPQPRGARRPAGAAPRRMGGRREWPCGRRAPRPSRGCPNAAGPYGRLLARAPVAVDPTTGTPTETLLEDAWEVALRRRTVTELAAGGRGARRMGVARRAHRPDRSAWSARGARTPPGRRRALRGPRCCATRAGRA